MKASASWHGYNVDIVKMLIEAKAQVNIESRVRSHPSRKHRTTHHHVVKPVYLILQQDKHKESGYALLITGTVRIVTEAMGSGQPTGSH